MRQRALAWLGALFVVATSFLYAASILLTHRHHMAAADSHYHFAVSREIWGGHIAPDVARGLPWTILRDMPVDHYWGYHLLVAPFAAFARPALGMKLAASALFTVVFASIHLFMRARGVRFAWAWALLPAMFSTQDWRYLQLRGGQIVVPLMFLVVHVAFFADGMRPLRRRAALVLLAYVGMLSYHGAILLLPIHLAGAAAYAFAARDRSRTADPLFVALGLALGLTINPYMDARASTWRFAAYHILEMGSDSARLYDDQEVAEFRPFPPHVFLAHPEWMALAAVALASVAYVAWRARRGQAENDEIVLATLVLVTGVLTARTMRLREYSVPFAVVLFALLARRAPDFRTRFGQSATAALVASLVGVGLTYHWLSTWLMIEKHLPTDSYLGARALLDENGARPILNIAEADYCMLKWQKSDVVCVQGLSRYFLYPDKALFHDVWELHDRADTSPETAAILGRFADRGVALVATHPTHKFAQWADAHPEAIVPVWRSTVSGATLWRIVR